jgi:hydroxyacylglutathione hydrolase
MKQLADGVWRLAQRPRPIMNIYLAGDVLVDAGTRGDRRRVFKQLADRELSALVLTHAHPDHVGLMDEICNQRGIPLACHAEDVDAAEGRRPLQDKDPDNPIAKLVNKLWAGPPHTVSRVLQEGDEIAGFRVLHTPGHSRGHITLFRDSDRVAICGDIVRNMTYLTTRSGILEPPDAFTYDPVANRRSIRRLAELEPSLILPGHGPEITDMAAFHRFVAALPAD